MKWKNRRREAGRRAEMMVERRGKWREERGKREEMVRHRGGRWREE